MPLEEAQVTLDLSAANIVSELTIDPASLPAALSPEGTLQVAVLVQTDDRRGLEVAAAGEGLVLHVKPPGGCSHHQLHLARQRAAGEHAPACAVLPASVHVQMPCNEADQKWGLWVLNNVPLKAEQDCTL